jgi:hypothetical protein
MFFILISLKLNFYQPYTMGGSVHAANIRINRLFAHAQPDVIIHDLTDAIQKATICVFSPAEALTRKRVVVVVVMAATSQAGPHIPAPQPGWARCANSSSQYWNPPIGKLCAWQ